MRNKSVALVNNLGVLSTLCKTLPKVDFTLNVLLQPYGREQFALTPLTLILDGFLIVSTTLLFMFKYAMFCHVDNFDST